MGRYIDVDKLLEALGMSERCSECKWHYKNGICRRGQDFEDICYAISDMPVMEIDGGTNIRKHIDWEKRNDT